MNNEFSFHRVATALGAFGLALLFSGCRTPQAERFATPWITTKQRLTLLSANDGQTHLKLDPAHITSNVPLKLDRNFTRDSITVVHLGPDHPPIVKTVYGTVPNTIGLAPYASLSRDGRYGFVISNTNGIFAPESADRLSVIDLASPDLPVVQQVAIPSPWMYRGKMPSPELALVEKGFGQEVNNTMFGKGFPVITGTLKDYDSTPRLRELRLPVLFTAGQYDDSTPAENAWYQSLVPSARLEIIEGAGHLTTLDRPERYAEVVREFLRSVERKR